MAKMGIQVTFVSPDCSDEELEAVYEQFMELLFDEDEE